MTKVYLHLLIRGILIRNMGTILLAQMAELERELWIKPKSCRELKK